MREFVSNFTAVNLIVFKMLESENNEKSHKDYDQLDEKLINKLRNNEINVDEVVRNLEKLYKG